MTEKNKLTNVHAHELSLVRRGANGKRFALTKGLTMNELIEAVLKTEAEGEAEMIAALGADVSEEQVELAKANFRLQVGFQDKLPKELLESVAKSACGSEEEPKAPAAEPVPESVQKALDEKDAEIARLKKSAEEADAKKVELEKAALRKSFVETVEKEYKHVAGSSVDEMADLLMDLTAAGGDLVERVQKTWKSGQKASEALTASTGTVSKNDGSSDSAFQKIEKAAETLVAKDGITKAAAIAQVAKEQPELYRAYKEEKQQGA